MLKQIDTDSWNRYFRVGNIKMEMRLLCRRTKWKWFECHSAKLMCWFCSRIQNVDLGTWDPLNGKRERQRCPGLSYQWDVRTSKPSDRKSQRRIFSRLSTLSDQQFIWLYDIGLKSVWKLILAFVVASVYFISLMTKI